MTYQSYSVGAFTVAGSEVGGEYGSRTDAQERFDALKDDTTRIAPIVLYGWQEDGTCDTLQEWSL
jgi:hypothetical protein